MSSINLLMMDWMRILELKEDDLIRLTLSDRSEITGSIYNGKDAELPVNFPGTFKFDVILIRKMSEHITENGVTPIRDDNWTIIYKHEVEAVDIIRGEK